jgi:hypothetical protein
VSYRTSVLLIFICFAFASVARADSLDEIAAFAEKICAQSISGNETSTSIEGKVNGDVYGLAKALGLTVAGGALITQDGTAYRGIPKDRLPATIPTVAQCKSDLATILIAERNKVALPPGCEAKISQFTFDANGMLVVGITGIRLGDSSSNVSRRLDVCKVSYHVERDSPRIERLEVTPPGGLLSGVTYYTFDSKVSTIGFALAASARDGELRAAAAARFGTPTSHAQVGTLHFDYWNPTPWTQLGIAENGGSLFIK